MFDLTGGPVAPLTLGKLDLGNQERCDLLSSEALAASLRFQGMKFRFIVQRNFSKDMVVQLEAEAKEDEEVYDKMVCWCESGDKEIACEIMGCSRRPFTTRIVCFL